MQLYFDFQIICIFISLYSSVVDSVDEQVIWMVIEII